MEDEKGEEMGVEMLSGNGETKNDSGGEDDSESDTDRTSTTSQNDIVAENLISNNQASTTNHRPCAKPTDSQIKTPQKPAIPRQRSNLPHIRKLEDT